MRNGPIILVLLSFFVAVTIAGTSTPALSSGPSTSAIYVSTQGNDSWDGLNSTYAGGTNGPKATIKNAVDTVVDGGTVYIVSGTYNENQISITKSMNLVGADQQNTIIDGNNTGQIFSIDSTANVNFSNLSLTNGYSSTAGAIDNQGTLTIKSCAFKNNNASISGGAISNHFNALTITNSTFTGNEATSFGGAIESQGPLTITNSTFSGNTVPGKDGDGGAIDTKGGIYLENCIFTNNTVTPDVPTSEAVLAYGDCGGAIYNFNSPSSVNTFKNVTFLNNNAPYGGAFDNYQGALNVIDCTFEGNNACVNGGAIENEGTGVLNVSGNTVFLDNTATWAADIFNTCTCTVTGIPFTNSKAATAGGSLNNQGAFNLTNCTFTNSSAGNNGGAIENHGTFEITNCTFKTSTATVDGGFIDTQGNMTIEGSSFSNGTVTVAQGNGGAIKNQGSLTVSNGCNFTDNYAYYGGALYNMNITTINDSLFSNNSAVSGGAISNYLTTLNVSGSNFASNQATNAGGAIENEGTGVLNVISNIFINNTAYYGGALFSDDAGTINVDSSTIFTNNTAVNASDIYPSATLSDNGTGNITLPE